MLAHTAATPAYRIQSGAATNEKIVQLWLHGKSPHTQAFYARVGSQLAQQVEKPFQWLTLEDVQSFANYLESLGLASSSQNTYLSAVKSLFSFASKSGMIQGNVGAAIKPPRAKDCLSQKILNSETVSRLIASEPSERNRLLLKLLYFGGLRASEIVSLIWRDLNEGCLTVYGKGGRTRVIRLPSFLVSELLAFRNVRPAMAPMFPSRKGGKALRRETVTQLVKEAAVRVGADPGTSAHWLRHCHASHSLAKGAPINLVQQTLGHANVATTSKYLHVRPEQSSSLYL